MSITNKIQKARDAIQAIVDLVREDVTCAAQSVLDLDGEIDGQMKDYIKTRDIDARYEYERDLDDLGGRRKRFYDEIFGYIDKGKDSLSDISYFVDDALEALQGLEESDDLPEDIDWNVQEA